MISKSTWDQWVEEFEVEIYSKSNTPFSVQSIKEINSTLLCQNNEISFVWQSKYINSELLNNFKGLALITTPPLKDQFNHQGFDKTLFITPYAQELVAEISTYFANLNNKNDYNVVNQIPSSVSIGEYTFIHPSAIIGENCIIEPQVYIGAHVKIGSGCILKTGAKVLNHSLLGNNVFLNPGCIIGSEGFGFVLDRKGKRKKFPQRGNVIIEEDVEIGANTTIDRATFGATLIKAGTKIDNLVQIAHNVEIGTSCVIASQSGIAGSTTIGANATLGAQVGIAGHIKLSKNIYLAGRTGVTRNIHQPGIYGGFPHMPIKEWRIFLAKQKQLLNKVTTKL